MSVQTLAIHMITIERKTESAGTFGGTEETWSKHLQLSARVQPLSSREQILYSRETSVVTHKIYIPGSPDVTAKDRILFDGDYYEIRGVRNIDHLDLFLTLEVELQV